MASHTYVCFTPAKGFIRDVSANSSNIEFYVPLERLNYRIPGHFIYMSLHKKATIVIYLVLQSTPTYVNAVAGYSVIAPHHTCKAT